VRRREPLGRDRPVEEQETDGVPERVVRQPPCVDDRVVGIGRDAVLAEKVLDRVAVVADVAQGGAEGDGRVVVGGRSPDRPMLREAHRRRPVRQVVVVGRRRSEHRQRSQMSRRMMMMSTITPPPMYMSHLLHSQGR
jgi:hypothetical protein